MEDDRMNSLEKSFVEAITLQMKNQKVRQRDLALALGISEKHMSQIFTGKAKLALTYIERISRELDIHWVIMGMRD